MYLPTGITYPNGGPEYGWTMGAVKDYIIINLLQLGYPTNLNTLEYQVWSILSWFPVVMVGGSIILLESEPSSN